MGKLVTRAVSVSHGHEQSTTSSADEESKRVLLVGAGWAGERYVRAITDAALAGAPIELVAICDRDDAVSERFRRLHIPFFTDLSVALTATRPDVVCVCVNEHAHFEVLEIIARCTTYNLRILCEKPFTETLQQALYLRPLLARHAIYVNMVERQSLLALPARQYLAENALEVRRVEFFWGKNRIDDPRPTIGDGTEVVHPLDLVRYLLSLDSNVDVEVINAMGTTSDFYPGSSQTPDSLMIHLNMGSILVVGSSSFVWPERRRQIVVHYVGKDGGMFQLVLTLDDPDWDNDSLVITKWEAGVRREILRKHQLAADLKPSLRGISKVQRFILESCSIVHSSRIVDIDGAIWVQRALDEVMYAAERKGRAIARLRPCQSIAVGTK